MKATLDQHPTPTPSSPGRRFQVGPARIGFLLVLLAAGLGLLARTAVPDGSLAGPEVNGGRAARGYPPTEQVGSPSGSLQEILAHPDIIPTHHHPLLCRQAPDFELADAQGKVWNLRGLLDGCPGVLIFYHGYQCPSCVRQLFEVHKDLPLFREAGARVVAISADPAELTRRRFEQYGPFGFPVLSDPEHKVAQVYGVFNPMQNGITPDILRHGTFVLDAKGTVKWANVGDAPLRRNPALLYQLRGALP